MESRKISILGTEYSIRYLPANEIEDTMKGPGYIGYCDEDTKEIAVWDCEGEGYTPEKVAAIQKQVLRREVVHAFLNESGLSSSSNQYSGAWAKNEEMVDWFAIMAPKIFAVFGELGVL